MYYSMTMTPASLEKNIQKLDSKEQSLNCEWTKGEKESIKSLWKTMENIKDDKNILEANVTLLGEQKIKRNTKEEISMKDFLNKKIKEVLIPLKRERDKKSAESKTPAAIQKFVQDMKDALLLCTWNNNDIVMALQVYLNGINDQNHKHATIPYGGNKAWYKEGEAHRLVIDGYLWPHTYNALWLSLGMEIPGMIDFFIKPWYGFERKEPEIIGKDKSWIPLTFPWMIQNLDPNMERRIEIINDPKIIKSLELLYLFYEWVAKKWTLSLNIDQEVQKIMTDPKIQKSQDTKEGKIDSYLTAIRSLNIKLAWENSDFKKWRDIITGFINTPNISGKFSNTEYDILYTLENDIWVHEYVANYIADKYIDLTKEPYASKLTSMELNKDKEYVSYEKDVNKMRLEQSAIQEKSIRDFFDSLLWKKKSLTDEQKQWFCEMFSDWKTTITNIDQITPKLILAKIKSILKTTEGKFKELMMNNYAKKRLFEGNIKSDKPHLDKLGQYNGKDKLTHLFADIQWIWWMNPSSKNLETTKFIAKMVAEEAACFAIWALTMWAWWVLLKSALYGKRAMEIARLANAGKKLSKVTQLKNWIRALNAAEKAVRAEKAVSWGGKTINTLTTVLWITVEWTAFYEWAHRLQNIFHDKAPFEGWNDLPEIAKTIAMVGAMKMVNTLVGAEKLMTIWWKTIKNPFNKLVTKGSDKRYTKWGKILGESIVGWWAIFTVEGLWEMIIDTDHDWTKEEFIQSVLMYMIFRSAWEVGKLRITKDNNWKPEIQKLLLGPKEQKLLSEAKKQKLLLGPKEQKLLPEAKEQKLLPENAGPDWEVWPKFEKTKENPKLTSLKGHQNF